MVYAECPNCNVKLEIQENDYMPGCREHEEVYCPECNEFVTKVFTSGNPSARVIKNK